MPLVSVVIPAFNAESTIGEAVGSVLTQTVSDLEIIIVDDGSRDRTLEQVEGTDPRVLTIRQPNAGPSVARNNGAQASRGEYVAFLDADDAWLPEKLERQLALMEVRPDVGAVQCGALYVDATGRLLDAIPCVPGPDPIWDCVNFRNLPAFPSSVVYRREAFTRVGPFDTSLTGLEDWEMAIRTAWKCGLSSVPEPLVLHRVHEGGRSTGVDINVRPGPIILERFFRDAAFPDRIRARRRRAYASYYKSLAGGYFQRRKLWRAARWALRSLWADPRQVGYMAALPLRLLRRARARSCATVTA